jgi:hypothetical protein
MHLAGFQDVHFPACSADEEQPEHRIVRAGRLRLVPVGGLHRWLDSNAARVFEEAP